HSLRDAELTVILSKEDLFARNWKEAERNRNRHGTAVREPVYLNSRSHGFQNINAGQVRDRLLEQLHFFDKNNSSEHTDARAIPVKAWTIRFTAFDPGSF
ncbi:MAG: hypothetical protein IKD66_07645, partial [Solobacterium sp.]|nr:hypothetical protein [Solobacterium sp.]